MPWSRTCSKTVSMSGVSTSTTISFFSPEYFTAFSTRLNTAVRSSSRISLQIRFPPRARVPNRSASGGKWWRNRVSSTVSATMLGEIDFFPVLSYCWRGAPRRP